MGPIAQHRLPESACRGKRAWLGLDIGGANLKTAHTSGWCASMPFAMWREYRSLGRALAALIDTAPEFAGVAVTMTGELADCFPTRAVGVAMILEQVSSILPAPCIRVYGVDGKWRKPAQAARDPWRVAASNWHALADWSRRWIPEESALLMDVGSTTIDVIPIHSSGVATSSQTDSERLRRRELLYTGVERSNLAGILRSAPLFGRRCAVMNEQFATSRDVYLWLGQLPENPDDCSTSDLRPATRSAARDRLARVVGEDGSSLTDADITAIAQSAADRQIAMLLRAIQTCERRLARSTNPSVGAARSNAASKPSAAGPPPAWILSGHGQFLFENPLLRGVGSDRNRISLDQVMGPELSRSAPAFAAAALAAEGLQEGVSDA